MYLFVHGLYIYVYQCPSYAHIWISLISLENAHTLCIGMPIYGHSGWICGSGKPHLHMPIYGHTGFVYGYV